MSIISPDTICFLVRSISNEKLAFPTLRSEGAGRHTLDWCAFNADKIYASYSTHNPFYVDRGRYINGYCSFIIPPTLAEQYVVLYRTIDGVLFAGAPFYIEEHAPLFLSGEEEGNPYYGTTALTYQGYVGITGYVDDVCVVSSQQPTITYVKDETYSISAIDGFVFANTSGFINSRPGAALSVSVGGKSFTHNMDNILYPEAFNTLVAAAGIPLVRSGDILTPSKIAEYFPSITLPLYTTLSLEVGLLAAGGGSVWLYCAPVGDDTWVFY